MHQWIVIVGEAFVFLNAVSYGKELYSIYHFYSAYGTLPIRYHANGDSSYLIAGILISGSQQIARHLRGSEYICVCQLQRFCLNLRIKGFSKEFISTMLHQCYRLQFMEATVVSYNNVHK